MCLEKKKRDSNFPPCSFIFTSGTPSLGLPGSVWQTMSASAPPHSDGPHPEAPSSQNTPPAETPSAHPLEHLMTTLAQAGWFQMENNTKRLKVTFAQHSWTLVLDSGSDSSVLIRELNHMFCINSHPRHTHTHTNAYALTCLHLIISPKISRRVQHFILILRRILSPCCSARCTLFHLL